MSTNFISTLILFIVVSSNLKDIESTSVEVELIKTLLNPSNYNKDIFPHNTEDPTRPLILKIGLAYINLFEINEKQGYMLSNIWYRLKWNDGRLKYNASGRLGENINVLRLSSSIIWKPSIHLANAYGDEPDIGLQKILVYPNGDVLWVPQLVVKTGCTIDVSYFPFDQQICILRFEDLIHTEKELSFEFYNNTTFADMSDYWKSNTWTFIKSQGYLNIYQKSGEPNEIDMTFYMTFRRKFDIYFTLLVLPLVFLSFTSLLTFLLPNDSKEKFILNMIGLVSLVILFNYFTSVLPSFNFGMTHVNKYMVFVLVLNILSIIATILILHLSSIKTDIPEWIRKYVLMEPVKLGRVDQSLTPQKICDLDNSVKDPKKNDDEPINQESHISEAENTILNTLEERKLEHEKNEAWRTVGIILNRILFIIFLLITVVGTGIYYAGSNIGTRIDEDAVIQSNKA